MPQIVEVEAGQAGGAAVASQSVAGWKCCGAGPLPGCWWRSAPGTLDPQERSFRAATLRM
ncbi:MAG TPA: hypothetical protein VNV66_04155 [Pilimelia sp.]|nr:hypothetical protein [Pilimelia sp.]